MSISCSITPNSLNAFRNSLKVHTNRVYSAAQSAMDLTGESVFNSAKINTPKVTGALLSSAQLVSEDNSRILKRIIRYGDGTINPKTGRTTASYAIRVHEIYHEKHPNSYKWLEKTVRTYGTTEFMNKLASHIRSAL